ncbi:MAG: flagellar filament capping protein FliD, partial [Bryobacteraceae bacterium]
MSTLPSISFTGISQFATDFQTILGKAAQVAQIPVTELQSRDSAILQKETALGALSTNVAALATSMGSLGTLAANRALSATSSGPSVVSVTNTGATAPVTYTIDSITSAASAASETSIVSYADSSSTQVSANGSMKLVVGSNSYDFTLTNNNLVGLRDQINSLGAGVTASILTTGNGNYLSVSANNAGATKLQLFDDPNGANTNILTDTNQGNDAVFKLNGITVSQAGNVVNGVIPGVTFTVLGASSSPVTLSLASDPTQLSSALQDFVTNYNS